MQHMYIYFFTSSLPARRSTFYPSFYTAYKKEEYSIRDENDFMKEKEEKEKFSKKEETAFLVTFRTQTYTSKTQKKQQ